MMDDLTLHISIPGRLVRIALVVAVAALIAAPLTAVATHTFNDVPGSHTFHADIAWLEATGVTKGCNPPDNTEYCPDDGVTRGQMAAFVHRLAENRVVDADKVDGVDASGFVRQNEANSVDATMSVDEPGVAQTIVAPLTPVPAITETIATVTLDAPRAGWAMVTLSTNVQLVHSTGTDSITFLDLSATGDSLSGLVSQVRIPDSAAFGTYDHPVSVTRVFPVSFGPNTFHLVGLQFTGTGRLFSTALAAMFVPSAYGAVQTASVDGVGDVGQLGDND